MRKRLRKKLHKGEFREFGFDLRFRLSPGLSEESFEAFLDAFLAEAISFGGGGREEIEGFVTLSGQGSATEEHRRVLMRWLEDRPEVVEYSMGSLVDAWEEEP
ncbi:MAG: DUF469 family protein [Chloroflexi bacterium]|nr:DUF469 family protein [Chloroflexota bacterium]